MGPSLLLSIFAKGKSGFPYESLALGSCPLQEEKWYEATKLDPQAVTVISC